MDWSNLFERKLYIQLNRIWPMHRVHISDSVRWSRSVGISLRNQITGRYLASFLPTQIKTTSKLVVCTDPRRVITGNPPKGALKSLTPHYHLLKCGVYVNLRVHLDNNNKNNFREVLDEIAPFLISIIFIYFLHFFSLRNSIWLTPI